MNIYYFANQIYQFSYALPIYQRIGGTFLVSKFKKLFQFKKYLKRVKVNSNTKAFFNTPTLKMCDRKNLYNLEGIIISLSNVTLNCDHNKCKTIYIGHGTGDKKLDSNAKILEGYDYFFISGAKHIQKLQDFELNIPEKKFIKIGNLRFDDYINNKIDREKELGRLNIIDRNRKNVLYAPTWKWGEGTFHKYVYKFSQEITKKHNLIVRPHHHDRRHIPKIKLWAKLNGIKHVYFSNPGEIVKSDTMHDFMVSDVMISDTSSILYEYLITKNPIIVAKNDYKDLHKMPDEMDIMNYAIIYDGSQDIIKLIDDSLADPKYKTKYSELLNNCFYFNDGKSVQRALGFIDSISSSI